MMTRIDRRAALGAAGRGLGVALALAAMAAPADAQLARVTQSPPDAPKLLVAVFSRDSADSALAVTIADGLRDRVRSAHALRFNAIPKAIMNENLVASGFPPDVPLEANVWRQLARFLNVRILVEGSLLRGQGDSVLVVARLAETLGNAPQSASASATIARGRAANSVGSELANRLTEAYRSFEHVNACNRWVDSSNFVRAREAADRALRSYAQSAGVHLCVARIHRAQNQPSDSILDALRRAELADSLNTLVLRQLAREYEQRGDTTLLLETSRRILSLELRDNDLRVRVAQLLVRRGQADTAVVVIDEGLASNPSQVELLQAKSIALAAANRWAEAASALEHVAEVDSANIDSLFGVRIVAYLEQIPDTTRLLQWTGILGTRLTSQPSYLYREATLRAAVGDSAGAMEVIQRFLVAQPTNGRGHLVLSTYLLARGMDDSALVHAQHAATHDSTLRGSASTVYLRVGATAFQAQNFDRTITLLREARPWAQGRGLVQLSFILGFAEFQKAVALAQGAQASRACDSLPTVSDLLTAAEANIIAGAPMDRDRANQLLSQYIPQMRESLTGLRRQLRCQ
jgi:tetratricopeptide (TPR) repeat protein/TolB-like protein